MKTSEAVLYLLPLILIVCHWIGDFVLQTDEMAKNKLNDWRVRTSHVITYMFPFACLVPIFWWPLWKGVLWYLLIAIPHWLIDTRRWVEPKPKFQSYPIVIDQGLHLGSLLIAAFILLVV